MRIIMSDSLIEETRPLDTLRRVLCWAFSQTPPAEFLDAVAQDEFTHDVIVRVASGSYLVFDTT
jgi:hypothetical protein